MTDLATIILQCALAVHPETVTAIIQQESGGNPYAINTQVRSYQPKTQGEAIEILRVGFAEGRSIDIGLMQVNSQWLGRMQVTAEQLLDPCTNIRIGTTILSQNYNDAWRRYGAERPALIAALSMYNTGNETRGVNNGYVGKVTGRAGVPLSLPQGVTTAVLNAVPVVHPRAAPTGFTGTGPKRTEPTTANPETDELATEAEQQPEQ